MGERKYGFIQKTGEFWKNKIVLHYIMTLYKILLKYAAVSG